MRKPSKWNDSVESALDCGWQGQLQTKINWKQNRVQGWWLALPLF